MTHPLTPLEKVALKPCPFCGGEVFADQEKSSFNIGCFRTKCGMEPYCTGDDLHEVVNQWNRRAALASGSGDHAELAEIATRCEEHWLSGPQEEGAIGVVVRRAQLEALLAENVALRVKVETLTTAGIIEDVDRDKP